MAKTKEIFTKGEASFLKALVDYRVEFMLIDLTAATLQGAPVVTQDIDLWFNDLTDPNIKKALKKVGGSYVPSIMLNPPMFVGEAVQLFDIVLTVHGLKIFKEEKKNTLLMNLGSVKVPVLKLERILKSKKAANRPKDKLSIPVLEDALRTINALPLSNKTRK